MDQIPRNKSCASRSSGSAALALIVAALLAAPMLYLLSVGPAVWLVNQQYFHESTFESLYAPLVWLHENTLAEKPLEWYVELWL